MGGIVTLQCWENCFALNATLENRDTLFELHKIGSRLKQIKDINSVNGVTFLLDSTLGVACDSSSSSSSEDRDHAVDTSAMWTYQLQLMAIFSAMMGDINVFPVQFNENAAWSCQEYSCLPTCGLFGLVQGNYLSPLQVNQTACNDGLLEPACRLAYRGLNSYTCANALVNNMTVAILNSNAHAHVNKHGHYSNYSPCQTFFDLRYAIGIHNANHDDMERFQSRDGLHHYLPDDLFTRSVVNKLYTCVTASCCPGTNTVTSANTCKIAYGHTGEDIETLTANVPLAV